MSRFENPLVLVTSSTEDPLSRTEAKLWLRIEEEEIIEDPLVDSLIQMARERYEAYTGRALLQQTYDYYLPEFPDGPVELPRWPLVSIGSIKGFTDTDATDTGGTSMSTSEYYVDTAREPGRVVPFGSYSYPTATRVVNGAIVRFTAGHSTNTTGVPNYAKTTLKNMIASAYEYRGDESARELQQRMDDVLHDELTLVDWG